MANIAGQVAATFFDAPVFADLTVEAIAAQETALQARVQTVLTALGVDAAIDLLHTQFLPDHSGVDAALDVLRVTVDEVSNIATITNVISQETMEDDLLTTTDVVPLPLLNPDALTSGVTNLQAIEQVMNLFASQFATGLPSESVLLPLIADTFLDDDTNKADFVAELSGDPEMVGFNLSNIQLHSLVDNIALISFDISDSSGLAHDRVQAFGLKKVGSAWQLHGNQHKVSVSGRPKSLLSFTNGELPHKSSGFEFYIDDNDPSNSPGVNRAVITGPGFPDGGLTYLKPDLGGSWLTSYTPTDAQFSVTSQFRPLQDQAIEMIPLNAVYTVMLYATDQLFDTYTVRMAQRPYTNAQLLNVAFPLINQATLTSFSTYNGGNLTIAGTLPTECPFCRAFIGPGRRPRQYYGSGRVRRWSK